MTTFDQRVDVTPLSYGLVTCDVCSEAKDPSIILALFGVIAFPEDETEVTICRDCLLRMLARLDLIAPPRDSRQLVLPDAAVDAKTTDLSDHNLEEK